MVSFSFKSTGNIEAYRDITDDVLESEFVPYAYHHNPHTLVTKNGELVQIIRISGLAHELLGHREANLRAILREAIEACIPSDSFALWIHTIRRQEDLSTPGAFSNQFALETQDAWEERNLFRRQFVNEVYISLIHEGQGVDLSNAQNFLKGILPGRDIKWRHEYIDDASEKLHDCAKNILGALEGYGAHLLTFYEKDGVFYSESCEFLEKLINLTDRPMAVTEEDLSSHLTSGEITFGFNAMEVRSNNRRNFASLLTIKEYKEASLGAIDDFLQLPIEFVATQFVNFVNPEIAADTYQDQKMLTRLSDDDKFAQLSEINDLIKEGGLGPTDYGEHQLSLFITADSIKLLERNIRHMIDFLAERGIVAIREDLRLEQCYWAQLPGNFEFIKRMWPNRTSRVAGFANLHNHPVGRRTENRWGNAVTTLHTASGIPYFFNFHQGEVGHTSIIGPLGSGKTVLANFLLTQSLKFNPRIMYFDVTGSTKTFIELLEGRYCQLTADVEDKSSPCPMNPFSLQNTPENIEFLSRWLVVLLRMAGPSVTDEQKAHIRAATESTLSQPPEQRHFNRFIEILSERSSAAAAAYSQWVEGGKYGHIFTQKDDVFDGHSDIIAFDLGAVIEEPAILIPAFSYLLQRSMGELDGVRPSILMLDEAWTLLKNAHVSGNIGAWLNGLTQRNAIAILATESIEDAGVQPFTPSLIAGMATQIYLPNPDPEDAYQDTFGLNDVEFAYLDVMDLEERHFLIKRSGEAIVAEMNLTGMDHIIAGLTGRNLEDGDDEDMVVFQNTFSEA